MLARFLITLFFSWAVNPAWVLVAHELGYGGDAALHSLLLMQGICVPFQLFLNECLAVARARFGLSFSWSLTSAVLLVQAAACWLSLTNTVYVGQLSFTLPILIAGFVASNILSHQGAFLYYRRAIGGGMSLRQAAVFGAIPGLAMLTASSAYFCARSTGWFSSAAWIVVLAPIPSIVQCLALLGPRRGPGPEVARDGAKVEVQCQSSARHVVFPLSVLLVASIVAAKYRAEFVDVAPDFGALILVAINVFASAFNTLTRLRFVTHGGQFHGIIFLVGFFAAGLAPLLGEVYGPILYMGLMLIAAQAFIVAAIEFGRGVFSIRK